MRHKRKVSLVIALIVMLQLSVFVSADTFAESGTEKIKSTSVELNLIQAGDVTTAPYDKGSVKQGETKVVSKDEAKGKISAAKAKVSFYDYIYQQLKKHNESINISSYKKYYNGLSKVWETITSVVNDHPELFFVGTEFNVNYRADGLILEVEPTYWMSEAEAKSMTSKFNAEVKKAVAAAADAKTDYQKALAVHDYLALNGEYDYSNSLSDSSFRSYGILVNRLGVCQSYALMYKYILQSKLGVKCDYAISDRMNHIWNVVKIGSKYYHVDVTWDDDGDGNADRLGRVMHTNFLKSDSAIKKEGHYSWTDNVSATSTTYDNYFWKDVDSAVFYNGSKYYYNKNNKLTSRDSAGVTSVLSSARDTLARDGSTLYFNVDKNIYTINTSGSGKALFSTVKKNVGGIALNGGVIRYGEETVAGDKEQRYTVGVASSGATQVEKPYFAIADRTSSTGIRLTWAASSNANGYKIYRKINDGAYSPVATLSKATTAQYINKPLSRGKKYTYKVMAYSYTDAGTTLHSSYSSERSAYVLLSKPKVSGTSKHYYAVTLKWKKVIGADGYRVYRTTGKGGKYSLIQTTGSKTTQFTNSHLKKKIKLKTGKNYYYRVYAYKNIMGQKVNGEKSVTLKLKPVPAKPKISIKRTGYTSVLIKWKQVKASSGYQVYRSTKKSSGYDAIKTLKASDRSYKNTGLSDNKTYYYKVRAYKKVDGKKVYGKYSTVKKIKID